MPEVSEVEDLSSTCGVRGEAILEGKIINKPMNQSSWNGESRNNQCVCMKGGRRLQLRTAGRIGQLLAGPNTTKTKTKKGIREH